MLTAVEFLILIFTATAFFLLIDLKYSVRKTIGIVGIFIGLAFSLYVVLANQGIDKGMVSFFTFSMPSFLLCWFLSKRKGSRFIFTFCTVDVIGFTAMVVARIVAIPFNKSVMLSSSINIILMLIFIFIAVKIRARYIEIQRTLLTGWHTMALVSVLTYMMMFFLIGYPTSIASRLEYIPTVIIFAGLAIFIYKVMFEMIYNSINTYNERLENQLLKVELELQISQVELKDIYYKMAFTDSLTGLKNRTAFDERVKLLEERYDLYKSINCFSMDLNNLKVTNDTFGHSYGDTLIKNFAQVLKRVFLTSECIYRVGGDEFIIFLYDYDQKMLEQKVIELEKSIEESNAENSVKIHVAIGIGGNIEDAKTIREIVASADNSMYRDKKRKKVSINLN